MPRSAAGEYAIHSLLSANHRFAVAEATPAEQYSFRAHPESVNFCDLMSHIAPTNYQFRATQQTP
jgi:hypothetical protein